MVRIDRVSKSSGGIEGKLMDEIDLAADRRARSEAVKLDLKAYFSGLKGCSNWDLGGSASGCWQTVKSNSPRSRSSIASGCSSGLPGGDTTGSSDLRIGLNRLLREAGLALPGVSTDDTNSVANESPKEGIESIEMVLVEKVEPSPLSDMLSSSLRKSSVGPNNMSIGLRLSDQLSSFSDTCCPLMISSTVKALSALCRRLCD